MEYRAVDLYEAIKTSFNLSELQVLCYHLGIDFDALAGTTLLEKSMELISYCGRRGEIQNLLQKCQEKRSHINWYELVGIEPIASENDTQLPPKIDEILGFAKEIAMQGARVAKDFFSKKENQVLSPETIKNLTTEADLAANQVIVQGIKKKYPDHHIISEEGGKGQGEPKEHGYTWVIDAIDGTVNFYHQISIFCTAVGILWDKVPIVGVIYNPISQELFYARRGGKAYVVEGIRRGEPRDFQLETNQESKLRQAVVITHLSSRRYARERFTTSGLLDALANASRSIRAFGSGQISLAQVAQGRLHAFVNNSTHSWDQVAGLVIVQEAGGIVTNFRGKPWSIDSESIIASANQDLHNQLVAIISAIYPFEGPIHRLRLLLRQKPELENKLIEFLEKLAD